MVKVTKIDTKPKKYVQEKNDLIVTSSSKFISYVTEHQNYYAHAKFQMILIIFCHKNCQKIDFLRFFEFYFLKMDTFPPLKFSVKHLSNPIDPSLIRKIKDQTLSLYWRRNDLNLFHWFFGARKIVNSHVNVRHFFV